MDRCRVDRRDGPHGQSMVMTRSWSAPVHGGTDGGPPIRIDFSTNAHPLGPNPFVREAVERADRSRYPDPLYTSLRGTLGAFHGVDAERIVVGASASELIWRLTRCWDAAGGAAVVTDQRTFGEYLRAAQALRVPVAADRALWPTATAVLHWCCNPDNPSGANNDDRIAAALGGMRAGREDRDLVVADLAYWPFHKLLASDVSSPAQLSAPWADYVLQLWSPNKLHGLTGVRGAYLVLPTTPHPRVSADALACFAPSWVLGVDGMALLHSHTRPEASQFLHDTAPAVRAWKKHQDRRLHEAGWQSESSPLHYGLWRPPVQASRWAQWHARLREGGIRLRDATSFGRPGWVRLVSRAPGDVNELLALSEAFRGTA